RAMTPQNLDHQPCIPKLTEVARRAIDGRDGNVDSSKTRPRRADDEISLELVTVAYGVNFSQHFRLHRPISGLTVANLAARHRPCRRRRDHVGDAAMLGHGLAR